MAKQEAPSLNVVMEETSEAGVSLHPLKQTLPETPETKVKKAQVLPIRTAFAATKLVSR